MRAGEFARAQQFMERVQAEFEADYRKEYWPVEAVHAFDSADPVLAAVLDRWVAQMPGSWAAQAARGIQHKAVAWARRGTAYLADTSVAELAGLRESAKPAVASFERAAQLHPRLMAADVESILLAGQTDATSLDERAYLVHAEAIFERSGTYYHLHDMERAKADARRACKLNLAAACRVVARFDGAR